MSQLAAGGFLSRVRHALLGAPIATKHAHQHRLPKVFALPVFASDALSSVAYATEQIMFVLAVAEIGHFRHTLDIALGIGLLLLVVVTSYYQTIMAYPMGGGSYRVATDNLGSVAGRIAGASLLIDYVLTVAVSVAAGVGALVSMAPGLHPYIVEAGVMAIAFVGLMNLRGAKESGVVFAVPTYGFIACTLALLVGAVVKAVFGGPVHVPAATPSPALIAGSPLTLFLVLRAFAAGCTALTGVEAIADGVQAFKPPEAKNAVQTLLAMAAILLTMFLGISWAAEHFQPWLIPMDENQAGYKTLIAQLSLLVYGNGWFFYALQIATATILILAANTAFADFPRLSSFIARDGFLPRQLASVGDRLVFQNGIILLSILAMILIIAFGGETHSLIPLYAVGVFTSFTLSQAGMFRRLLSQHEPLWKAAVSGLGCIATFTVMVIILTTKFREGAWIIVVAMSVLMATFWLIRRHYDYLAGELSIRAGDQLRPAETEVLLLVPRLHRGILHAISVSQAMAKDVRAIHVTLDRAGAEQIKKQWTEFGVDLPLVILESPYRSLVRPVTDYVDQVLHDKPGTTLVVIVPQAVPKHWWQGILHNNAAVPLKMALKSRSNVVIANVRYFLS